MTKAASTAVDRSIARRGPNDPPGRRIPSRVFERAHTARLLWNDLRRGDRPVRSVPAAVAGMGPTACALRRPVVCVYDVAARHTRVPDGRRAARLLSAAGRIL